MTIDRAAFCTASVTSLRRQLSNYRTCIRAGTLTIHISEACHTLWACCPHHCYSQEKSQGRSAGCQDKMVRPLRAKAGSNCARTDLTRGLGVSNSTKKAAAKDLVCGTYRARLVTTRSQSAKDVVGRSSQKYEG